MKVLVTGGAGYVGSRLVPALLEAGYCVRVVDLYWYGRVLKAHPHLEEIEGDIRNLKLMAHVLQGCEAVIHLACISNDPSFELDPALGKSINLDAFEPFVRLAKAAHVKRFIYASSSSVYGIKEATQVTEEMSLEPLTDYSRFKALCEEILLTYQSQNFVCTIVRPATVCGYAPRQRFDVIVNLLVNQAYHLKELQVLGGAQKRPNIHIEDLVAAYLHILAQPPEKVQGEIFNIGHHNQTVLELAHLVADQVGGCKLRITATHDTRSYHISSQKIAHRLGFLPRRSLQEAISDLLIALRAGKFPNALQDSRYYNIKMMRSWKDTHSEQPL